MNIYAETLKLLIGKKKKLKNVQDILYHDILKKTWVIYDPRIRLDLFIRGCDLFQENVKELIDIYTFGYQ